MLSNQSDEQHGALDPGAIVPMSYIYFRWTCGLEQGMFLIDSIWRRMCKSLRQ